VLTDVKLASAPISCPDRGTLSSLRRMASSIGGLPVVQRAGGLMKIGEGLALTLDLLVILVSLACQQQHVIEATAGNAGGDGLATTGDEAHPLRCSEAVPNLVAYLRGILVARIVVGNHYPIGQSLGHGGHQRPLAAIPVATTAEQAQQIATGMGPQGFEDLFQRIGGMCVVDYHQRPLPTTQALHAADRPLQ